MSDMKTIEREDADVPRASSGRKPNHGGILGFEDTIDSFCMC